MPTNLQAATSSTGAVLDPSSGDGTLVIKTGATAGAQVNALSFAADGTPTFLKVPVVAAAPAFGAYLNSAQSITGTVKITYNAEEFDTANAYDATTNYRFQPLVAGYYQLNAGYGLVNVPAGSYYQILIYKNGAAAKTGTRTLSGGSPTYVNPTVSSLVFMNGTTDYVEIYGYISGASTALSADSGNTYFNGVLVRGA